MKINRTTLVIAILTVVCAILWLVAGVYKTSTTSTITPQIKKVIEPLDPSINDATFEKLKQRQ